MIVKFRRQRRHLDSFIHGPGCQLWRYEVSTMGAGVGEGRGDMGVGRKGCDKNEIKSEKKSAPNRSKIGRKNEWVCLKTHDRITWATFWAILALCWGRHLRKVLFLGNFKEFQMDRKNALLYWTLLKTTKCGQTFHLIWAFLVKHG